MCVFSPPSLNRSLHWTYILDARVYLEMNPWIPLANLHLYLVVLPPLDSQSFSLSNLVIAIWRQCIATGPESTHVEVNGRMKGKKEGKKVKKEEGRKEDYKILKWEKLCQINKRNGDYLMNYLGLEQCTNALLFTTLSGQHIKRVR